MYVHVHTHDTGTTDIKRKNMENIRKNKLVSSKSMYFDLLLSREWEEGEAYRLKLGLKIHAFLFKQVKS